MIRVYLGDPAIKYQWEKRHHLSYREIIEGPFGLVKSYGEIDPELPDPDKN